MIQAPTRRLWDIPVRVCHWLMVALVAACWWTAENHQIVYHSYCAYGLLAVLIFRIYWGFFGSYSARFKGFLKSPVAVFSYTKNLARRDYPASAGHNPLGAYSVVLILLIVLVQIGLGLFAIDVDGFDGGPFADYLSFESSRQIAEWHEAWFTVIQLIIVLHIAAVIYYFIWRGQNLLGPMLHGKTNLLVVEPVKAFDMKRLLPGLLIAAALVWLIS